MYLVAPTVVRVPAAALASRARERFGADLRRAGSFAQLCLLGAQACLDAAPAAASLGVLWNSSHGPVGAVRAAVAETRRGEPVMPFGFVALQPHLAATLLAQRGVPVTRAAFVRAGDDAWPWLLARARSWLERCDQVLLGWVEESTEGEHQSDWCVLQRKAAGVSCETLADARGALPATGADWLARLAAWLAAPRQPLALRGGGAPAYGCGGVAGWRFAAVS